jgi:predicted RNA-binding Zn-ribbon protein involved in translation (DUF1610 family)
MDIKEYDCPNCGGPVMFDSGTQLMKCSFCATLFDREMREVRRRNNEPSGGGKDGVEWTATGGGAVLEGPEADDLAAGGCPSCGAEFFGGKTTIATVCPFCGNAQIVEKRISGTLKPDYIIPFKANRKTATKALTGFCEGKRLLPDSFNAKNRQDRLQGVYAPFWLFDGLAEGSVTYVDKRPRKYSPNRTVVRAGCLAFEKIPVDASQKMDDAYMEAIEPFDCSRLVNFHPSYLAGYTAEKHDVDAAWGQWRAKERIKTTFEEKFQESAEGYSVQNSVISVTNGKISYGLFPVWVLNSKHDGDDYLFMMNGQTGKFVGRLPVDEGKAWKYAALLTLFFWAVAAPLLYFLNMAEIIPALINTAFTVPLGIHRLKLKFNLSSPAIAFISLAVSAWGAFFIVNRWKRGMDTVHKQADAFDYVCAKRSDRRQKW